MLQSLCPSWVAARELPIRLRPPSSISTMKSRVRRAALAVSALVPFASPSKVAKQGRDPMSPGSILALYGIDRSQVRTLVRKVSDCSVN